MKQNACVTKLGKRADIPQAYVLHASSGAERFSLSLKLPWK